jgi:hypothetical protein
MSKTVYIKLTKVGPTAGPFTIYDQWNNVIATDVSRESLINGVGYMLDDGVTMIKLSSTGECSYEKVVGIVSMTANEFFSTEVESVSTGCLWKHLVTPTVYNTYYGNIEPYTIEYPLAFEYHDELVQNVKDFTKVYRYLPNTDGAPSGNDRVELDREYFNKAIIYNGQQCSGLLELVPKPLHNLKDYMSYPKYNSNSKTITFTKSDNFYQYNTFWSVYKDKSIPMFLKNCKSLSIDKELNQSNMDYSYRSFQKEPIRSKEVRVRHILDNRGDIHLVSRFVFIPSMISYK